MSEEEIIKNVKRIIEYKVISNYINNNDSRTIQGLLDLYQKEKEKNKELMKPKYILNNETGEITKLDNEFISKDKIRELYEHYKDTGYYELESVLQELLEERN